MSLIVRLALLFMSLLWLIGIFTLFLVPHFESLLNFFPLLNMIYSRVCHQNPAKLIYLNQAHTLVCARCTGIYSGALLSSIVLLSTLPKFRTSTRILIISSIPMICDIILYISGAYQYSHYIAFFTGALFGTICFFYIFQGINLLISELRTGR